ncbi:sulfite exporter TauE/SafE family protein [Acetobacterium bakii]|uniref:Probable membrane transporter protein n=1 Tax=Acetobacterium bakii TaxID=52689 RepID=A0A0L6TZ92_9FIRM|nr:sulfite exporter TauE/SafE family protein [Acetobacterium bakii]KNZ41594.1 membrane protein [Acetobacterium bakii]
MQIGILYFLVIVLANTVGAISGMGGGVIIKPMLDAIGVHSLNEISFYSSIAVFTMAIVATWQQFKNPIDVKIKLALLISFGSFLGGVLGQSAFSQLLDFFASESTVQWIQIILTVLSLVFALLYTIKKWKSWKLKKMGWYLALGLFLGFLSTLLGIGGGPINVALLMLCFGIPIKDATVYSIITIFFSQLSTLITIGLTTGYEAFDLSLLAYIIPAAMIGGFLGARLSGVLSEKRVLRVYQLVVMLVIILNIANGLGLE